MSEKNLISVIIPVYNVENYLSKCVKSVLNQTYKNIEIILVNDGSTDSSGKICDQIKEIDKRIRVIHKKNGGLSSARNAGIEESKGEFIIFIDSDDYVSNNMVSFLYNDMIKTHCDISVCGYYEVTNEKIKDCLHSNEKFVLSSQEALKLLYSNYCVITSLAWNKIYKRELFTKIKFAEGRIHEDDIIILDILKNTEKISFNLKPLYYYIQRNNSITKTFNVKRLDGLYALENRNQYFKEINRVDLIDLNNYKKYHIVTDFIKNGQKITNKNEELKEKIKDCKKQKKEYFKMIKNSKYLNLRKKIFVLCTYYLEFIYNII